MYKRKDSEYWWVRFYHKRKGVQTSTKQTDFDEAKKVATKWYLEKQAAVSNGFAPTHKTRTFAAAMDKAAEQYDEYAKRGIRSAAYARELRITMGVLKRTCIAGVDIAAVDQGVWNAVRKELLKQSPKRSEKTLHQYKNVVNITLNEALRRHDIKQLPQFAAETKSKQSDTYRTWFQDMEYHELLRALVQNVEDHKNTRWKEDAEELLNYVVFVVNTGLRVGEARNVRFCDITIAEDKGGTYFEIRNIKGKRGENGECKSFYMLMHDEGTFPRILRRHGLTLENYKASTATIFKAYHRDMFREVLKKADLYWTKDRTPRKRDLMSLRHTYICQRLLNNANIYEVAVNCRTSTTMIHNHYARYLSVLQSKTINVELEEDE